jgi:hypothetical protein
MIDVRTAVQAAVRYARELYGESNDLTLMVEEVEPSADDRYWLITLSLPDRANPFAALARTASSRTYKIFEVDAQTGEVRSMKIRSVA